MLTREGQIKLMESAEERNLGYLRAWLTDPEIKAALHRYDDEVREPESPALCRAAR